MLIWYGSGYIAYCLHLLSDIKNKYKKREFKVYLHLGFLSLLATIIIIILKFIYPLFELMAKLPNKISHKNLKKAKEMEVKKSWEDSR